MSPARLATRLYLLALRAFPRRHRAAYTAEMIDTFERELARVRRRGLASALWFAAAASVNVIGAGLGERRRHRRAGLAAARGVAWTDVRLAWRMLL